jgi:hypothetical protein
MGGGSFPLGLTARLAGRGGGLRGGSLCFGRATGMFGMLGMSQPLLTSIVSCRAWLDGGAGGAVPRLTHLAAVFPRGATGATRARSTPVVLSARGEGGFSPDPLRPGMGR